MSEEKTVDYYEVLQVSASAEPETINRVYRLLAQRFHPDNQQTGDESRFRTILEAYTVLSDPEKRARYDVVHQQQRQDRWRLVATGAQVDACDCFYSAVRLAETRRFKEHRAVVCYGRSSYGQMVDSLIQRVLWRIFR